MNFPCQNMTKARFCLRFVYEKTSLKYLSNVNWASLTRHQEYLHVLFFKVFRRSSYCVCLFNGYLFLPAFIPAFGRNRREPGSDTDQHSPCQGMKANHMIIPASEQPFLHLICRHSKFKKRPAVFTMFFPTPRFLWYLAAACIKSNEPKPLTFFPFWSWGKAGKHSKCLHEKNK